MNKNINKIDDLVPHILKLGFTKLSDKEYKDKSMIKYRISSKEEYIRIRTIKNNDGTEEVFISFMYEDVKTIRKKGFDDVIEILKEHFKHIYRKEAINNLLSRYIIKNN